MVTPKIKKDSGYESYKSKLSFVKNDAPKDKNAEDPALFTESIFKHEPQLQVSESTRLE